MTTEKSEVLENEELEEDNLAHQILKFSDESFIEIEMWSRKTYTYLEINTPERCTCGVVAKPGIATGSRSK